MFSQVSIWARSVINTFFFQNSDLFNGAHYQNLHATCVFFQLEYALDH